MYLNISPVEKASLSMCMQGIEKEILNCWSYFTIGDGSLLVLLFVLDCNTSCGRVGTVGRYVDICTYEGALGNCLKS